MERTDVIIGNQPFIIHSDDDIVFTASNDYGIAYDEITLSMEPRNNEHGQIINWIAEQMRIKRAQDKVKAVKIVKSFGGDLGAKTYTFNFDNRLRFKLEELNINKSHFINSAIAEKLLNHSESPIE